MNRSARERLNRETRELIVVMNQIDLIDIYRKFHLNTKEYSFLSTPHGTFFKIVHIINHKANLNIYKRIERAKLHLYSSNENIFMIGCHHNMMNYTKVLQH